jgi:hypothetical protein
MFIYGFPLSQLFYQLGLRDLSSKVSNIFPELFLPALGSETFRSKVSDIFPGFFLQEPGLDPFAQRS